MAAEEFLINPNFRLITPNLTVAWHTVDYDTLSNEAAIAMDGRYVFRYKKVVQVMVQRHGSQVDMIRHAGSDFEVRGIQKWLRELFRDIINDVAREVLPDRVRYWEEKKGLRGKGVEIERMRNSVLACCTGDNIIKLQPFLALFRQEWIDEIILHEMAHYIHKHHRKPFWDFLSQLLGTNARKAKAQKDIEMSPYYNYCLYLTKK